MAASFVLGSEASSTYPEGTPPALPSPAAALDGHVEHPAMFAFTTSEHWLSCSREMATRRGRVSILGLSSD